MADTGLKHIREEDIKRIMENVSQIISTQITFVNKFIDFKKVSPTEKQLNAFAEQVKSIIEFCYPKKFINTLTATFNEETRKIVCSVETNFSVLDNAIEKNIMNNTVVENYYTVDMTNMGIIN